ncbi:hypothetical protein [uncultured Mediterranean phage uvDeep-CGR2-KM18-C269]|nr:hypothetical protein [uncultured Mediterranean phage uvDeep-CGR2-KM18-C269]
MGNVFDSKMPEEHYKSVISDLQCELNEAQKYIEKLEKESRGKSDRMISVDRVFEIIAQALVSEKEKK